MVEDRPTSGHQDRTGDAEQRPIRTAHARQRAKPGSLLASRAATEYTYVGQDLRRITLVSLVLLAIMLAAWLAIAVFGIIPLDFY
jgi:hypothetical protein